MCSQPKVVLRRLALATALAFGLGLIALGVWIIRDLPDLEQLSRPSPSGSSELTTHLTELPSYVVQALLAAEDREFYRHSGIDPFAIARAIFVDLRAGRALQGGSTITEQLAKNLLPPQRSELMQKLREMALALMLERRFSKDRILELYLNRVYFGGGAYGIEAAVQRYFGKRASEVTLYEAAMLVGLLKAPSRLNPLHDSVAANRRAQTVLHDMVAAGFLTDEQVLHALAAQR
jgi:penicillin-binding protein 1A